jgi:hypothetical protein
MKKIRLTILSLLVAIVGYSATIQVVSPGNNNDISTNWQTAVNAAAAKGDVLEFPAGTFTMIGNITTTKSVSLKGQGIGVTIIKRSEASSDANIESWFSMITYNINKKTPCGISIRGITFKSRIPSAIGATTTDPPIAPSDGYSLANDCAIKMVKATNFRIHDCRFENFGNAGVYVIHYDDLPRGLIDHNQFYHNAKGADGLGLGYGVVIYGEGLKWYSNPLFGTENFIFVEDNTFDYHRHSIANAACAKYVFRYNKVYNNIIKPPYSHAIDTHPSVGPGGGGNTFGSRAVEIYNDSIMNNFRTNGTTPIANGCPDDQIEERCIGLNSGDAVVHDIYVKGYRFAVGFLASEETSSTYPRLQQLGWISALNKRSAHTGYTNQQDYEGDAFCWNVTFQTYTLTGGGTCVKYYNYDADGGTTGTFLKKNRDYHEDVQRPGYKTYKYPHPLQTTLP